MAARGRQDPGAVPILELEGVRELVETLRAA
jgi:hypothetical protein